MSELHDVHERLPLDHAVIEARSRGLPHPSVLDLLEAAYQPCPAFAGACAAMRWQPASGHVPRGFAGAFGDPHDVRLVLVTAEPGDPYNVESYPATGTPRELLAAVSGYVYSVLESAKDLFHRNLRYILDLCWPEMSLEQQLHRAWLTDSVLCSAAREGGPVVTPIARECRVRYLEAQLRLFPNALVVALGGKAQRRLQGWPGIHPAYSVAPPGCNRRQARPSWHAIAEKLLSTRGHR